MFDGGMAKAYLLGRTSWFGYAWVGKLATRDPPRNVGDRRPLVIVIAPANLGAQVLTSQPTETLFFGSVSDFVRSRRLGSTLRTSVAAALREAGCRSTTLSTDLRRVVTWLARQPEPPCLKVFSTAVMSRRTFFRRWKEEIRETPSDFLRRVRVVRARQLLRTGAGLSDAAARAGYLTVGQLRRDLDWHHNARNGTE